MKKLVYTSVLALLASSAYAADTAHRGDQFYGRAEVGASMATQKVAKRTKPVFGLAAGYKIDNMFRVELNARMRATASQGAASKKAWSLLVNGIYDVNINNSTFTPYVLAGVGYGHDKITVTVPASGSTPAATTGFKKNQFIYNVGFGTRVHVAKQVDLDFGYRFVGRASKKLKHNNTGAKVSVDGLNTHELVAGVMFWF